MMFLRRFRVGGRAGVAWLVAGGGREGWAMGALLDRAAETAALEGVLAAVRDGLSGVLVLRGDAGIGKTALLEWAAGQADDMRLARVTGVQAEMGMGFAGLHQLLIPFLGGLEQLPGPQRQALGSAFGLVAGPGWPGWLPRAGGKAGRWARCWTGPRRPPRWRGCWRRCGTG